MPSLENYIQKIHKKLNNEGLEERKVNLSLCILLPACVFLHYNNCHIPTDTLPVKQSFIIMPH